MPVVTHFVWTTMKIYSALRFSKWSDQNASFVSYCSGSFLPEAEPPVWSLGTRGEPQPWRGRAPA